MKNRNISVKRCRPSTRSPGQTTRPSGQTKGRPWQKALLTFCLPILLLCSGTVVAQSTNPPPDNPATFTQKININTASASELTDLKGIGAKKAERIIQYRTDQGAFKSIEALTAVKGVSLRIVEQNREKMTF